MHGDGRMMWMWFHTLLNDTLLVRDWYIKNAETMFWSCVVITMAAMGLEALRWIRWVTHICHSEEKTLLSHLLNTKHHLDTLLYFAQCVLAHLLMLSFMTFSIWLCLSLCVGLAIGHYLFGTKRFKLDL